MCTTCGCSDTESATITDPVTGAQTAIAGPGHMGTPTPMASTITDHHEHVTHHHSHDVQGRRCTPGFTGER